MYIEIHYSSSLISSWAVGLQRYSSFKDEKGLECRQWFIISSMENKSNIFLLPSTIDLWSRNICSSSLLTWTYSFFSFLFVWRLEHWDWSIRSLQASNKFDIFDDSNNHRLRPYITMEESFFKSFSPFIKEKR